MELELGNPSGLCSQGDCLVSLTIGNETEVDSSNSLTGFCVVVVEFGSKPYVDRCHTVLSLVWYTQAPNDVNIDH